MKRIDRLKHETKKVCTWRRHDMKNFVTLARPNPRTGVLGTIARSECRKCGEDVQVETHPAPNSIDIGGEALGPCKQDSKP